jgi:hypothetical protein
MVESDGVGGSELTGVSWGSNGWWKAGKGKEARASDTSLDDAGEELANRLHKLIDDEEGNGESDEDGATQMTSNEEGNDEEKTTPENETTDKVLKSFTEGFEPRAFLLGVKKGSTDGEELGSAPAESITQESEIKQALEEVDGLALENATLDGAGSGAGTEGLVEESRDAKSTDPEEHDDDDPQYDRNGSEEDNDEHAANGGDDSREENAKVGLF